MLSAPGIVLLDLGETPALPSDRRSAAIVAAVLVLCCLAVVPSIMRPLGVSYPIFAIVIALSIAAIAVTAVLLWAQARITRSLPLSVLSIGYALTAAVMLPYMLFYRGLWPQLGQWVSADPQTPAWLWVEWHAAFICSTIAYSIACRVVATRPPAAAPEFVRFQHRLLWIGGAIVALTVPPLIWIDGLPPLAVNGQSTLLYSVISVTISVGALASIAFAYGIRRFRTMLDLWLAIACLSMFADMSLTHFSRQFAAGWYASRLSILLAASAVLSVLLFQTANIYGQLAATAERLRDESLTDVLTGLANRRSFEQRFEQVLRECARDMRPVALLAIDVDHFKAYNDTHGHQAGDACLRAVATALQDNVGRARDLVARTGGEEMAVLMPDADVAGALVVAERLRAAVEAAAIPSGTGAAFPVVTISIGVTATREAAGATVGGLMESADRALYRAKRTGRNRVIESSERFVGLPDA